MFFLFAGFTVMYLITAALFFPETKEKRWKRSKSILSMRHGKDIPPKQSLDRDLVSPMSAGGPGPMR